MLGTGDGVGAADETEEQTEVGESASRNERGSSTISTLVKGKAACFGA